MVSWRPPPPGSAVSRPNGPFDALSSGTDQVAVLRDAKTIGSTMVSGVHISYTRLSNPLGVPRGGVGVSLADQAISNGPEGIQQGFPRYAGVETLYFNCLTARANPLFLDQVNNNDQAGDNFSKVSGKRTLKFGGQYIGYRVLRLLDLLANGKYSVFGSVTQITGNGYADLQQSSPPVHESAAQGCVFGKDSWRIKSTFTFNLGVRWDYVTPWSDLHHQITALLPGVQSQTFPGAPLGYLVPGDHLPNGRAIPAGIAPTPNDNFSPRFGIAYSSNWCDGLLSKLTGGPGKNQCALGRRKIVGFAPKVSDCHPALRAYLHEPRAVRHGDSVHWSADSNTVHSAVSRRCASLHPVGDRYRHDRELGAVHTRQRCGQRLVPEQDRLHHVVKIQHRAANRIEHAG